jgi:hypothetical protein
MCFLHQKEILTKDNLSKRNCQGNMKCCFCNQDEKFNISFSTVPLAKLYDVVFT